MSRLIRNFLDHVEPDTGHRLIESTHCKIIARDLPDTIVAFSAINCPPGKFFASKALAKARANLVFLNCTSNSWYLDGIPLLGSNLEESAENLAVLMESVGLGGGRRIFWGGSMGGYGAVAMGSLMNADLVVATGAELDLFIEGGNSQLILKHIQGRHDLAKPDIRSWIDSSTAEYFLYCGEFAYHDLASLCLINSCNRAVYRTMRDFGHPLPSYIQNVYGLLPFINHHVEHNRPFDFKNGELGILWMHPDWWSDLHAVANNLPGASASRLISGLGDSSLPAELRAHMAHSLSRMASLRGDPEKSLSFARNALELADECSNFHLFQLACALRDSGKPVGEWLPVASRIRHAEDPDRLEFGDKLIRMMFDGISESKGMGQAGKFLSHLMRKSANHGKRQAFLESLLSRTGDKRVWLAEFTGKSAVYSSRSRIDHAEIPCGKSLLLSGYMFATGAGKRIVSVMVDPADAEIQACALALPSPGVAKLHPGVEWSENCRFRMQIVPKNNGKSPIILRARTADGEEFDWLSLRAKPIRNPDSQSS